MVGFPLDILFERGEEIRNYSGGDPELLEQGQQANRWEVKPGRRAAMRPCGRISFCGLPEPGLKMGLVITTTKRIYYLTCASVKASPTCAIRWKYADEPLPQTPPPNRVCCPSETRAAVSCGLSWRRRSPRRSGSRAISWMMAPSSTSCIPRSPCLRVCRWCARLAANGPQLVNSRQFLNTVILDELPARVELRVGTGRMPRPPRSRKASCGRSVVRAIRTARYGPPLQPRSQRGI